MAPNYRLPEHVMVREVTGELVLLNLDTEAYFGLDEVGAIIVNALDGGASVDEAARAVTADFDVDEETAKQDIIALVAELTGAGLLESA